MRVFIKNRKKGYNQANQKVQFSKLKKYKGKISYKFIIQKILFNKTYKIWMIYHKLAAVLCISFKWKKQLIHSKKKNFLISKKTRLGKCLYKGKLNKTTKVILKVLTKVNLRVCKHIYSNYHNLKKQRWFKTLFKKIVVLHLLRTCNSNQAIIML